MDTQNTQEVLDALSFLGYHGISASAPDPTEDYIVTVEILTKFSDKPVCLDISGPEIERLATEWRLLKNTTAYAEKYQVTLPEKITNAPRDHE